MGSSWRLELAAESRLSAFYKNRRCLESRMAWLWDFGAHLTTRRFKVDFGAGTLGAPGQWGRPAFSCCPLGCGTSSPGAQGTGGPGSAFSHPGMCHTRSPLSIPISFFSSFSFLFYPRSLLHLSPIRPRYVVQATPAFSDMVELAYNPNTEDRRIVIWRPAWITQ